MNLPAQRALQKLETLRHSLVKLTKYEEEGAPFGLRWFLFTGGDLYPGGAPVVLRTLQPAPIPPDPGENARSAANALHPPRPTDDYAATYDTLKAYLLYHFRKQTQLQMALSCAGASLVAGSRWMPSAAGRQAV